VGEEFPSDKTPPYERACRRGRKDQPVAIDLLIQFAKNYAPTTQTEETPRNGKPFSVHLGALSAEEMVEYGKLASNAPRTTPADGRGFTEAEARAEAARCLHCDCRKPLTCRLRKWADAYGANPNQHNKRRHNFVLYDRHGEILYEPGKCIACGLCVQIAAEARERLGLTFLGRGFTVRVAAPFEASLAEALRDVAGRCADACPTAALVRKD
jgi:ferredoxin